MLSLDRPNVNKPRWDTEHDRGPFRWRRARVGHQANARELGASLFELEPGGSTFPLHAHHANEELLVVLSGRPSLLSAGAERELEPGEAVSFPVGRAGAHRIDNRGAEPARILIVSTMIGPDVVEQIDSRKVYARSYPPGADRPADAVELVVRREDSRDFLEGEL